MPFDNAVWQRHLTMPFDNADWQSHLTSPFDMTVWYRRLASPFDIAVWPESRTHALDFLVLIPIDIPLGSGSICLSIMLVLIISRLLLVKLLLRAKIFVIKFHSCSSNLLVWDIYASKKKMKYQIKGTSINPSCLKACWLNILCKNYGSKKLTQESKKVLFIYRNWYWQIEQEPVAMAPL